MTKITLSIRVDPQVVEALRVQAEREDRTISWIAARLLESALDSGVLRPGGARPSTTPCGRQMSLVE